MLSATFLRFQLLLKLVLEPATAHHHPPKNRWLSGSGQLHVWHGALFVSINQLLVRCHLEPSQPDAAGGTNRICETKNHLLEKASL